jgi:hypothetical protein
VVTGKISSWFDGWSRTACALVLATLIAIMALSALAPSVKTGSPPRTSKSRMTDAELYTKVISEVRSGTPYYASVVRNHRENGYPLRPFFTVRMPTLAKLSAMLPPSGARFLLLGLIVAAGIAWFRLIVRDLEQRAVRISALVLVAVSLTTLASPVLSLFHDAWAGVLMALSLALNQQRKVAASIAVGLAAALIRELAVPFLVLMACAAVWEKKWREVAGWAAAIAVTGCAVILHAGALSPLVTDSDLSSQGWKGMGGWTFYLSTMTIATPLSIGPAWLARMLIPLALFGWFAWRSPLALRVSGLLIGYGILLAAFSRPDTFYWGLMMTPLLLAGLAFAPLMVARLLEQIRSSREITA